MSDAAHEPTGLNSPRAVLFLKGLSAALGALLVGGLGLMGYLLASGAHLESAEPAAAPLPAPAAASLVLAPGETLADYQLDGTRLILRLRSDGGERLVVLEADSGRVISEIELN